MFNHILEFKKHVHIFGHCFHFEFLSVVYPDLFCFATHHVISIVFDENQFDARSYFDMPNRSWIDSGTRITGPHSDPQSKSNSFHFLFSRFHITLPSPTATLLRWPLLFRGFGGQCWLVLMLDWPDVKCSRRAICTFNPFPSQAPKC